MTAISSNDNNGKCCSKHYPRCPYWHSQERFDACCFGCDKPGIGSNEHNPSDNDCCNDCGIICLPCALVLDILCCPFMVFGCYTVKPFE
ncbi:hypothetical protein CPAV1605_141 [seawater metagenome]|uniref:Uncharacterized protein n=1 Tax=seawater metagenome TaxID=1561972 RepID=A0A5E8CIF9_9ZZZZ